YLFNPLGNNTPLFNSPQVEDEISHLAEPLNVPMPISRRVMDHDRSTYYGEGKSIAIHTAPAGQPQLQLVRLEDIDVCDLRDVPGAGGQTEWAHTPVQKVTVDPVLGRLAFPAAQAAPAAVNVSFEYGFGAKLGGGEYEREGSFELGPDARVVKVPN